MNLFQMNHCRLFFLLSYRYWTWLSMSISTGGNFSRLHKAVRLYWKRWWWTNAYFTCFPSQSTLWLFLRCLAPLLHALILYVSALILHEVPLHPEYLLDVASCWVVEPNHAAYWSVSQDPAPFDRSTLILAPIVLLLLETLYPTVWSLLSFLYPFHSCSLFS